MLPAPGAPCACARQPAWSGSPAYTQHGHHPASQTWHLGKLIPAAGARRRAAGGAWQTDAASSSIYQEWCARQPGAPAAGGRARAPVHHARQGVDRLPVQHQVQAHLPPDPTGLGPGANLRRVRHATCSGSCSLASRLTAITIVRMCCLDHTRVRILCNRLLLVSCTRRSTLCHEAEAGTPTPGATRVAGRTRSARRMGPSA